MSTRRTSKNAGYTMIEVMAALGILAVGATGVIALQKATYLSQVHARNLVVANAIAATWAERVRVDALQWNAPKDQPSDLGQTDWLWSYETQLNPMIMPDEVPTLGSPIADAIGRDAYTVEQPVPAFCTQLRVHRYVDGQGITVWDDLLRVEIRVFWDRGGNPVNCSIDPITINNSPDRYGAVYLTTAVRRNDIRK
jgi:type IV pilus assembly protein PilV